MKKQLIVLAIAACSANIAFADTSEFYVGGQLGSSLLKTDTVISRDRDFKLVYSSHKPRFAGSVITGYNFNTQFDIPIRTDLSFTFRDNKQIKTGTELDKKEKIQTNTLMFNTYYDIYTNGNFTPYVTLRAGAAFVRSDENTKGGPHSTHKRKFAYSIGLGGSYKITEHWFVDVIGKSTFAGKLKDSSKNTEGTKIETHDLMVGVFYTF